MRKLPWGIILLVFWGLFLVATTTVYLKYFQPEKLGHTVSDGIESNLQVTSQIDFIKFQLFPQPALIIKGVHLKHNTRDINVKLDEAHANISWKTLLLGRPVIGSIDLFNPTVELVTQKPLPEKDLVALQNQVTKDLSTKEIAQLDKEKKALLEQKIHDILNKLVQFEMPYFLSDASLHIRNGFVKINFKDSSNTLDINKINLNLRLPGLTSGLLDLRIEETSFKGERLPNIKVNTTSLSVTGWSLNTNSIEADLHLQTQFQMGSLQKLRVKPIKEAYRYFPMPKPARLSIRTSIDYTKHTHLLNIKGLIQARLLLPMNKHNTPVSLDIPFSLNGVSQGNKKSMLKPLHKTQENSKYLDAFLKGNPLPHKAVQLPSLYIDTVNLHDAYIKIGADSLNVTGELLGLYPLSPLFQGTAKIHHFSLPRWVGATRKMSGGLVNALNNIKGELDFVVNKRGIFASKLQTSVRGISVEGVGSCANFKKPDIALRIKPTLQSTKKGAIDINPLFPEINGVSVRKAKLPPAAVPARNKKDKSPSIFVDYHIDVSIPHVDIWKLTAKNVRTLISPNADETPTIDVSIDDLYNGTASAFALLDDGNNYIKALLKNVDIEEPMRNIAGFTVARGILEADAEVRLSGNSMNQILSSLHVKTIGKIENGSFHSDEALILEFKQTHFRLDTKTLPFYIPNIKTPQYFQMKGDYDIAIQDDSLKLALSTNAILDFSSKNGVPLRMEPQNADIQYYTSGDTTFENMFIKGKGLFGYDTTLHEYITIKDFDGTLNGDILTGSYNLHKKEQVDWSGDIHFDHINLDHYFFDEGTENKKEEEKTTSLLPIYFLSNNSIDYKVSAKEAVLMGTTIENLTSHIRLNNKKLTMEKTQGEIKGGGNIQAFLEGKVTENTPLRDGDLQSQFKFQMTNANMLAITQMRKHETLMAGNALVQMTGNGIFQTTADILRKLNGTWNVNIQNGYIQSVKPNTPPKNYQNMPHSVGMASVQTGPSIGSKTRFNNLLASGTIANGILSNPKFVISSPSLSVVGHGTVDLPSREINASALATYRGVSEIPITITGTLDDPVTSVKVLNAIAGTLGNIGSGFFGVLGTILSAPVHLFTQEKTISTP